jgi:hypothetical protein
VQIFAGHGLVLALAALALVTFGVVLWVGRWSLWVLGYVLAVLAFALFLVQREGWAGPGVEAEAERLPAAAAAGPGPRAGHDLFGGGG